MSASDLSILFFLQWAVILAACRIVGWLAQRVGQPQVVGEMVTGVLLGPSFFGMFWPEQQAWLFPADSKPLIYATCQVSLALYMFLVGLEFRADLFRAKVSSAAAVSIAGMITPFLLGAGIAAWLVQRTGFFAEGVTTTEAMLFLGASMCITAFPMLARIIFERGLAGTSLGTLALAAGAMDDAAAWCLLAVVLSSFERDPQIAQLAIGGGIAYVAVVLTVGRWAMRPLGRAAERAGTLTPSILSLTLTLVMLGAWYTDAIGIYAVFGAFILGCAMPRGLFADQLIKQLEPTVSCLLLPMYFIYSGLNTRLDLVTTPELWGLALLILFASCLGKGVACWAAARLTGADQPTALALGTLMNARGLMELIILNIGLQRKLITPQLFSLMVLMAIVTTVMASPIFEWVYGRRAREQGLLPARAG